jgi:SAM-dependent methyltransferase
MQASYAINYRRLWEEHWWWRARRRFVLSWLDRLATRRSLTHILDVGCGDGLFFDDLARYGEPRGVESDASLVDSKGKWTQSISIAPFGAEYRDARRYDLVLMLDSLEHIEDDAAAATAAAELLEPGGFLFLTVPALPSLWSAHDEANRHFRRYTPDGLRAVINSAGLVLETANYYFGWAALPLYARKYLSSAQKGEADYSVLPPPGLVNRTLYAVSLAEQTLTGLGGTPWGSSLFAVCRKAEPA